MLTVKMLKVLKEGGNIFPRKISLLTGNSQKEALNIYKSLITSDKPFFPPHYILLPVLIHIHTNLDVKQGVNCRGGQVESFAKERLYTIFPWHHTGAELR